MAEIKVSAGVSSHLEALRKSPLSSSFMLQNSVFCSYSTEVPISLLRGSFHLHVSNGASNPFSALNL